MFVITADQVDSRHSADLVDPWMHRINNEYGTRLILPADRNAGDEMQILIADAGTTLDIVLRLTRDGQWSVGLGVGSVRQPLPSATRQATGPAFFAARDAVVRAKKQPTRFAVMAAADGETAPDSEAPDETAPGRTVTGADVQALTDLALALRERRSEQGWQLYDLLAAGKTQREAAAVLGISAPAASSRAKAAGLKLEQAAIAPLGRLLDNLDRSTRGADSAT